MSGLVHSAVRGTETIGTWFGLSKGASGNLIAKEGLKDGKTPAPVADLGAPTVDTAANLNNQTTQLRNQQRGVLANIYAGNSAPAPQVATKTLLGG